MSAKTETFGGKRQKKRGEYPLHPDILWLTTQSASALGFRAASWEFTTAARRASEVAVDSDVAGTMTGWDGKPVVIYAEEDPSGAALERRLDAAGRQRKILSALHSLGPCDQAALVLSHTPMLPALHGLADRAELPVDDHGCSLAAVVVWMASDEDCRGGVEAVSALAAMAHQHDEQSVRELSDLRVTSYTLLRDSLSRYRAAWREQRDEERAIRRAKIIASERDRLAPRGIIAGDRVGRAGAWPMLRRAPDWARRTA